MVILAGVPILCFSATFLVFDHPKIISIYRLYRYCEAMRKRKKYVYIYIIFPRLYIHLYSLYGTSVKLRDWPSER